MKEGPVLTQERCWKPSPSCSQRGTYTHIKLCKTSSICPLGICALCYMCTTPQYKFLKPKSCQFGTSLGLNIGTNSNLGTKSHRHIGVPGKMVFPALPSTAGALGPQGRERRMQAGLHALLQHLRLLQVCTIGEAS